MKDLSTLLKDVDLKDIVEYLVEVGAIKVVPISATTSDTELHIELWNKPTGVEEVEGIPTLHYESSPRKEVFVMSNLFDSYKACCILNELIGGNTNGSGDSTSG